MATDHIEALDGIAKLDDHWLLKSPPDEDENGDVPAANRETGIKPSEDAVKAAMAFIADGGFYPTPDGGVQWEAAAGAWDVVITFQPDGTATVIYS